LALVKYQDELGLNEYAFGWRDYDPAIGRWNVIDQLAEKYITTSPYAFVQNNPLINREIDGRYFDEKNEKKAARIKRRAEKRAGKLERKADRLAAKGQSTGDLRDRASELRGSAQDVRDMRNDASNEYRYASVGSKEAKSLGIVGPSTLGTGQNSKGDNVVSMFTEKNMGNRLHEGRHGGQNARGEINAITQSSSVAAEVSAYRAQYSWGGSLSSPTMDLNGISNIVNFQTNPINRTLMDNNLMPVGVTTTNINNISQINSSFVGNIVEIGSGGGYQPLPTVQNYLMWIYAPLPLK
jgi:RHS repeat-associated protein